MTVSNLTLRRAAALREMASLGVTMSQASILFDLSPGGVSYIIDRFGIVLPRGRAGGKPWLQDRIIRDFGKDGVTAKVLAERNGTTENCVKVTIHRLRKAGLLPHAEGRA